jgi:hypothetical protein
MSVYHKLMAARLELQSRPLSKSGHNKFAGYSYFELGDFLPTIQEIFAKHELCGIISYGIDVARLTIVDMSDNGGSIEITSPMSSAALKGCHEVQNLGAVQTYIRRYLWVTAMEIVEHDALDSSQPLKQDVQPKVIKAGAKDGIGDELPQEWKDYLVSLAQEVSGWAATNPAKAKALIEQRKVEDDLDGDMLIYMERHLDSKVRTALRKVETV